MNLLSRNELKMVIGGGPGDTETLEPGGGGNCCAVYIENGVQTGYTCNLSETEAHAAATDFAMRRVNGECPTCRGTYTCY